MAKQDIDLTDAQVDTLLTIPVKRLILWLSLTAAAMVAILVIWANTHNRYVVTVDVRTMDAPVRCWDDIDGGLLTKKRRAERDFAPSRSYLGYCGVVMTTHGSFALPETYPRPWMGQTRAEVHDRLKRGCRYDVVVVSEHGRPTKRHAGRTLRNPPQIRRVMFSYPC